MSGLPGRSDRCLRKRRPRFHSSPRNKSSCFVSAERFIRLAREADSDAGFRPANEGALIGFPFNLTTEGHKHLAAQVFIRGLGQPRTRPAG